jgi:glycosyltransferase involved in cell wall biosynthesis
MFGKTGPSIHGKEFIYAMKQLGVDLDLFPPPITPYYLFQRVRDSKKLNRIKNWRNLLFRAEPYFGIAFGIFQWIRLIHGHYDFTIVRSTDFSVNLLYKMKLTDKLKFVLEVNSILSGTLIKRDIDESSSSSYINQIRKRELSILKKAKAIYVVSENLLSTLKEARIHENKIEVIHNGVDAEHFHPDISGDRIKKNYNLQEKIVVGFLGEVRHSHDMETLVKGFAMASSVIDNLILFIVGPYKSFFNQMINKHGIQSKVLITGQIDHADVPEYLAAFDIAVSPIKDLYPSPIKNYEYMAMGKAIIATDLKSTTSILKNTGILIKPGSVVEMHNGIVKLAQNENLRNEMGKQARKMVLEKHTWKHNARSVLDLCRQSDLN